MSSSTATFFWNNPLIYNYECYRGGITGFIAAVIIIAYPMYMYNRVMNEENK